MSRHTLANQSWRPNRLRRFYTLAAIGAILAGALIGTGVAKAAPINCAAQAGYGITESTCDVTQTDGSSVRCHTWTILGVSRQRCFTVATPVVLR